MFLGKLSDVFALLGGGVAPKLQAQLLGRDQPLTPAECEDVRVPCTNAVLKQYEFLQVPYDQDVFADSERVVQWFDTPTADHVLLALNPIEQRELVIHHAAANLGGIDMHHERIQPYN